MMNDNHAAQRASERHGLPLTRDDQRAIAWTIWAGGAQRLDYPVAGEPFEAWLVPRAGGPPLPILFDAVRSRVVTVLPRDWQPLRTALADVIRDGAGGERR